MVPQWPPLALSFLPASIELLDSRLVVMDILCQRPAGDSLDTWEVSLKRFFMCSSSFPTPPAPAIWPNGHTQSMVVYTAEHSFLGRERGRPVKNSLQDGLYGVCVGVSPSPTYFIVLALFIVIIMMFVSWRKFSKHHLRKEKTWIFKPLRSSA